MRLVQDRSHRRRARKGELTRLERRLLSIHRTELLAGCTALPFLQRPGDVQGDFHFLFQISAICSAVSSEAKHSFSRACSSSRTARSHHRCSWGLLRTSSVRSPDEAFALQSSWTATTFVGRSISDWWCEEISRCFLDEPRPPIQRGDLSGANLLPQTQGLARSPDHRPPLQKDYRRVSRSAHS